MSDSDRLDPVTSLQVALELSSMSLVVMRQNLRREQPALSEDEIDARLQEWMTTRPGAELGDGAGTPRPIASLQP